MLIIVRVYSEKRRVRIGVALMAALAIAACGDRSAPDGGTQKETPAPPTAAELADQTVLTPAEYLASSPYKDADVGNGERQAQICRACHSFDKGGPHTVGPALHGFFGRKAAADNGYDYSDAMEQTEFVWTPQALNAWLAQPQRFLPGNRMTFAGVHKAQDRNDLIAYLLKVTAE